jgi:hypothetical protein
MQIKGCFSQRLEPTGNVRREFHAAVTAVMRFLVLGNPLVIEKRNHENMTLTSNQISLPLALTLTSIISGHVSYIHENNEFDSGCYESR